MEAYAATFKRVEKKYCLSAEQYRTMLMITQQFLKPDDYPKTVVSSLYFDTPENQLISRSLEKPLYKEKLRVRSYGIAQPDGSITPVSDQVFVELKKKYRGVVYKRRLALSTDAARAFLSGMDIDEACALFPLAGMGKGCTAAAVAAMCGAHAIVSADDAGDAAATAFASAAAAEPASLLPHERQVAREIMAFLKRYQGIRPAMVTQCTRTAWAEPGNPGCSLRITFDSQPRATPSPSGLATALWTFCAPVRCSWKSSKAAACRFGWSMRFLRIRFIRVPSRNTERHTKKNRRS